MASEERDKTGNSHCNVSAFILSSLEIYWTDRSGAIYMFIQAGYLASFKHALNGNKGLLNVYSW